jgi:hypothetical protein
LHEPLDARVTSERIAAHDDDASLSQSWSRREGSSGSISANRFFLLAEYEADEFGPKRGPAMIVADRAIVRKIEAAGRAESVAGLPHWHASWYHPLTEHQP